MGIVIAAVHYHESWGYNRHCVQEMLINYSGGFVRRGLLGEIFHTLYSVSPFPVHHALFLLIGLFSVSFIIYLINIFRKEGWSVMLLITPLLMLWPFLGGDLRVMFSGRRDYIIFWCIAGILHLYKAFISRKSYLAWLGLALLSIVMILLYEPAYFFIIPLLFLFHFSHVWSKVCSWAKALWASVLLVLPASLTFLVSAIFKGNKQVINTIWASWQPCFERYASGIEPIQTDALFALTQAPKELIYKHINYNWRGSFISSVPAWPFTALSFIIVYYLITRINTVDLRWNKLRETDGVQLSNFIMVQFVCMFPMFTLLSLDFGRTVPCWAITSMLAFHVLRKWDSAALTRLSAWIQGVITRCKLLNHPVFYLVMMLVLPLSFLGGARLQFTAISRYYQIATEFFELFGH